MTEIQSLNAEPLAIVLIPVVVSIVFFLIGVISGVILILRWQDAPQDLREKRAVLVLIAFCIAAVAAGVFAPDMWRSRDTAHPPGILDHRGWTCSRHCYANAPLGFPSRTIFWQYA
jgi:hypothetical protein